MSELRVNPIESQTLIIARRAFPAPALIPPVPRDDSSRYNSGVNIESALLEAAGYILKQAPSCPCPHCYAQADVKPEDKKEIPWPEYSEKWWEEKSGVYERYISVGKGKATLYRYGKDGPQEMRMKYTGRVVIINKDRNKVVWRFDLSRVPGKLLLNSFDSVKDNKKKPEEKFNFEGVEVGYVQGSPGKGGSQRSYLYLPDGSKKVIVSESVLSKAQLQNLAKAIVNAPPKAFSAKRPIFVLDEIGGVESKKDGEKDKTKHPIKGCYEDSVKAIFVRKGLLDKYEDIAHTLWHEAGHRVDSLYKRLSKTIKRKDGKLLFGSGVWNRLIRNKSGSVSWYASTNRSEDFAECFRVVGEVLVQYKKENKGKDLLKQTPEVVASFVKHRGYSGLVNEKLFAIFEHVYGVKC